MKHGLANLQSHNSTNGHLTLRRQRRLDSTENEKVWATVLVIAYVRTCLASKKDEWELVVEKAIDWLEIDQGCCDVEALIEKSEGGLK
nr:expressed protein [Hymenolepis microstoma]